MADLTPVNLLFLVSGTLLSILGLAVLALQRRHIAAVAFGVFAVGVGGLHLYVGMAGGTQNMAAIWFAAAYVVINTGFLLLIFVFPNRVGRQDARSLAIAFGLGLAGCILQVWGNVIGTPGFFSTFNQETGAAAIAARIVGSVIAYIAIVAGAVFFPLRARHFPAEATAAARSLALFAVGVACLLAGNADGLVNAARGDDHATAALVAGTIFVPSTFLWALAARGAHPRIARNTAIAHATIFTAAAAFAVLDADLMGAIISVLGAFLLGYAVLRGLIEGLDLKVRFAISKSTVAAVFIAVFFIASEAAQQFFGDTLSSKYVGIGIAGTLVFAMAPLQRAAERLAEKTVPIAVAPTVSPHSTDARSGARDDLRTAYAAAARDGRITHAEELALARLATRLGLDAATVLEIQHEALPKAGAKVRGARHRA